MSVNPAPLSHILKIKSLAARRRHVVVLSDINARIDNYRAREESDRLLMRCQSSVDALLPRQLFIIILPQHGQQFHPSELARMDIMAIAGIILIIRDGLITN